MDQTAEVSRAVPGHQQRLNQELNQLPQGTAFSFSPPAIPGVGTSGGFTFVLEDRGGNDIPYLAANVDKFMAAASKRPEIAGINSSLLPSVPQQFVDVDRDKVLKQGVPLADVYATLQAYMGGFRQLLQSFRPPVASLC